MKNITINKTKISLILNYLIFIFVVLGTVIMFTGYKFTYLKEPVLEAKGLAVFKFFTVDSNILMGISAIIFAHKERKLLTRKINDIPLGYYILKFMATVSVCLTFLIVFLYLGRIAEGGLISLLQNSNLFFHLIIPLLSIVSFTIFEHTDKIKFNYVICGLIPMLLYGIYYVINIIVHVEDGVISPKYDWYWFAQNGVNGIYVTAFTIIAFTYVIGIIIWIINKKISYDNKKIKK